jgi:guanylate kinase
MEGKLIIFSAPSGAGKTTIVRHLLSVFPQLEFSVSACNREKRGKEENGVDYYFLSTAEFKQKIDNNEFAEWEEVYAANYYGTLHSEMKRIWDKGHVIAFDIDVLGGINLKKQFGDRALSLFVMPPSIDDLEKRLLSRETDSPESIAKRMNKAKEEIARANLFDKIILNDKLEDTLKEAESIVAEFIGY